MNRDMLERAWKFIGKLNDSLPENERFRTGTCPWVVEENFNNVDEDHDISINIRNAYSYALKRNGMARYFATKSGKCFILPDKADILMTGIVFDFKGNDYSGELLLYRLHDRDIRFSLSNTKNRYNAIAPLAHEYASTKWINMTDENLTQLFLNLRYNKDDVFNGLSHAGCFIATAVYGSSLAEEVILLKKFRDHWLLNFPSGKAFVRLYYRISPPIAQIIGKNKYLRNFIKLFLIIPLLKFVSKLKIKQYN